MGRKNETSLLVQGTFRIWNARVGSKVLAAGLADELKADDGTIDVLLKLVPSGWLKNIRELAGQAFVLHRAFTMPIPSMKGTGIYELPVRHYKQFQELMDRVIPAFEAEREKLAQEYPSIVADAPRRLGSAFDASRFPDPGNLDEFRRKFSIEIKFMPYPDGDNLPRSLSPEDLARLEKDIREEEKVTAASQQRELLSRIMEPLTKLGERVAAVDAQANGGPKTKLHESAFDNLREVVDLPIIRDHEDPVIQSMRTKIKDLLDNTDATMVRGSPIARRQTLEKVEALAKEISEATKTDAKPGDFLL